MSSLTKEQIEDITFLRETMRWPYWPWCPVKRHVGNNSVTAAYYNDKPKSKAIVYRLNVFKEWTEEEFNTCEKWEYKDIHEMLLDGWQVD